MISSLSMRRDSEAQSSANRLGSRAHRKRITADPGRETESSANRFEGGLAGVTQGTGQGRIRWGGERGGRKRRFTIRDIAAMGMMLALIEVSKRALEFLPNVELVTLLFMVFTLNFGLEVLAVSVAFTLVETAFWGVNNWVIMYLYIWPAEILFVYFTRRYASYWFHAVFSALFGFCFGALCSIPYLAVGGWSMAFTWWVAGIPYDILHGVSNFVLCLILYRPLMAATKKAVVFLRDAGQR